MRVSLEPSFVLHARAFRDTSLILEIFSQNYGRLSLIALGARRKQSQIKSLLSPFIPLLLSWSGKTELFTLAKVEAGAQAFDLCGNALLSGFYLNELLMRLLVRHDPHPKSFLLYQKTLAELANVKRQYLALRLFEKNFLADIGYGLQLAHTISDEPIEQDFNYSFRYGSGFEKTSDQSLPQTQNIFSGKSLLALNHEKFTADTELRDAKRLLRIALDAVLGDKPIKSRELFIS
ncbi:MAG: DNA repair protein RecO [Gammaproteobacteria bacterium]|nr:DNA repair protein RecO [Gammaproteobacteria bacterium]